MVRVLPTQSTDDNKIVLGVLNSIEEGAHSQRRMAAELGIALGLVNAYLKRCVKKGLVKVGQAPARRYAYYLTPQGFAEKSRLTVEYLSYSFSFFRQAKADCAVAFEGAKLAGFKTIVLAGHSDLAEIAILCAADSDMTVVALVDPSADSSRFAGIDVVSSYDDIETPFDAVMITSVNHARDVFDDAVKRYGSSRVVFPRLLGLPAKGAAQ